MPPKIVMDDKKMDTAIAAILRLGVSAAAILVVVGGVAYLRDSGRATPNYATFQPAVFHRGPMEAGLLVLILTPVVRVVFSIFAFGYEKDRTYVVVTVIVLALLAVGWLTGFAA